MPSYVTGPDGLIRPATPVENGATNTGWNIFEEARRPPEPSVYRSQEGVGYPSASRALARIPPNQNDANGYYKMLGVEPSATLKEIKAAIRRIKAANHPDNYEDADEVEIAERVKVYARVQEIADVLLDPVHKANYDSIPQGRKLIDSEVLAQMADAGIHQDDPGIQQFERQPEDDGSNPLHDEGKRKRRNEKLWDYLATDHNEMDLLNAQEWYAHLLDVAPLFRYDATVKVLMHDGKSSAFKKMGGIMLIPRAWEPSQGLAFHMFMKHIGWPKVEPRHLPGESEEEWPQAYSGSGSGMLAVSGPNVGWVR